MSIRLTELADLTGADLHGDGSCDIRGVGTLQNAGPGEISFLTNIRYRKYLPNTRASALILERKFLDECPVPALVSDNPLLAYARIAAALFPMSAITPGRHPTAMVAEDAEVDPSAWIGPRVVIESGVRIGAHVSVGPGSVIGRGVGIGDDSQLIANVTLCHDVVIGRRAVLHPGVVIGSDGFGLANDVGAWVRVPQLGTVIVGDDVDIGANTTIDRGTMENTVIEDGVKLDNQIQIAHNVWIGRNTAIAACTGIAGSTRIGRDCTLAGGVGVAGHLELGDNVHISGQSLVTRSFEKPGYYSGNLPAVTSRTWRRAVAHIRRMDDLVRRFKVLEKVINQKS